jgi:hypothetical protein
MNIIKMTNNGFHEFDAISKFNGLEASHTNVELLKSSIEKFWENDHEIDYSTKGVNWTILDYSSMGNVEILLD